MIVRWQLCSLFLIALNEEILTFYADSFSKKISATLWELINPFDNKNPAIYFSFSAKENVTQKLFHDILDTLLATLGRNIRSKAQIETIYKKPSKDENLFFNVMLVDSVSDVRALNPAIKTVDYNYNEYYLIYLHSSSFEDTIEIFEYFWGYYIFKVNIVTTLDYENYQMTTFFPFNYNACRIVQPAVIGDYRHEKWILYVHKLFPDKTRNFNKCNVKFALFHVPPYVFLPDEYDPLALNGIDGIIATELAKSFNMTLEYIIAEDKRGVIFENGSSTGALEMIEQRIADITLGCFRLTYERKIFASSTQPYFFSNFVYVVKLGTEPFTSFQFLYYPFEDDTWFLMLSFAIASFLIIEFTKKMAKSTKPFIIGEKNSKPVLNFVATALGIPINEQILSNSARMFLMMWLLLTFLLRCGYQSKLYGLLSTSLSKSPPSKFEELQERKFQVVSTRVIYNSIANVPMVTDNLIPYSIYDEEDEVFPLIFIDKRPTEKIAAALPAEFFYLFEYLYSKQGYYYKLPQMIMSFQTAVFMTKHSFLINKLNKFLRMVQESGFKTIWLEKAIHNNNQGEFLENLELKEQHWVTQNELTGIYVVCGCLLGLSTFIFILELVSIKIKCLETFFNKL